MHFTHNVAQGSMAFKKYSHNILAVDSSFVEFKMIRLNKKNMLNMYFKTVRKF